MNKPNIASVHYFAEIIADNISHLVRVRKSKFNDVKKVILQASA